MMVGNVTSEASHSIIGTLSAKPVSMETRASNIDFKALLKLPIGSQAPGLNSTEDDALGDKNKLFSLEELVGSDGQGSTVLDSFGNEKASLKPGPSVDENIAAEKIQNEFNDIAAGLSLEPFFVPVVQNKSSDLSASSTTPSDGVGTDELSSILGSAAQLSERGNNMGSQDSKVAQTAKEILKPLLATNRGPLINHLDQSGISTLNLDFADNKLAGLSIGENRQQYAASNPMSAKAESMDRVVGENLQRNVATDPRLANAQETAEGLARAPQSETRGNISSILSSDIQKLNSNPKTLDSIELRLANRSAAKPAAELKSREFEISSSSISVEKRGIGDMKNAGPVFDTAAISSNLEKNLEMSTTANPLTNLAVQPTTQKPVSFDWNAPRFAERFAAEVSGMSVNGDSKKFEINPRNLGRLEVSFVARGTSEVIRIEAESDAARDAIVQNSQAIQEMLKAQGRPDLTIRVEVRDAAFASSQNGNLNLAQQDSPAGRENGSNTSTKSDHGRANDGFHDPEIDDDDGRYA